MDHDGHAHEDSKDMFDIITYGFRKNLEDPQMLKVWYLELTSRDYHEDFDPYILKPKKIGSPLMKELMGEAKVEVHIASFECQERF